MATPGRPGMAITFQGDWEEEDDIEALSFKSMMKLMRYLVVFLVKGTIGIYVATIIMNLYLIIHEKKHTKNMFKIRILCVQNPTLMHLRTKP